jgi:hypothetical protein
VQHKKPRYALDEAFRLLDISRKHGYRRIKAGLLHVNKDGRRTFITAAEIDRYTGNSISVPGEPRPFVHPSTARR